MNCLADTVTVIRHLAKTGKIGRKARTILDDAEQGKNRILISVISIVEIMYLAEKNRISINLLETLEMINKSVNYSIVDLTPQIVILAEQINFPELHDRLIMATAKYIGIPILTAIRKSRNPILWKLYGISSILKGAKGVQVLNLNISIFFKTILLVEGGGRSCSRYSAVIFSMNF